MKNAEYINKKGFFIGIFTEKIKNKILNKIVKTFEESLKNNLDNWCDRTFGSHFFNKYKKNIKLSNILIGLRKQRNLKIG